MGRPPILTFFFFNDTATTEIYTLSLHDALPIWRHPLEYASAGKITHGAATTLRSASSSHEPKQGRRRDRHLADRNRQIRERVLDGVGDGWRTRDGAAFAHALDPELVDHRAMLDQLHFDRRQVVGARDRVIHERAGQELASVIVDHGLHQPSTDTLGGAPVELPLDDHRVDGASRVVDDEELQQPHGERLHIDLDDRGLHAEGPRDRLRIEVRADAEPRLADPAERLRLHRGLRDAAEADEAIGHTGNVGAPALDAYVGGGTFEQLGGDSRRALAHLACRACDGGPCVGGHAAPTRP